MLRKTVIFFIICILTVMNLCASAESFSPSKVASTNYTQTQWLSNDNSRALLVCMTAADYCAAEGIGFANVAAILISGRSYIQKTDELTVYIPDGDSCLCIRLGFDGAAKSASASQCDVGSIDKDNGNWYVVTPESCAVILAD